MDEQRLQEKEQKYYAGSEKPLPTLIKEKESLWYVCKIKLHETEEFNKSLLVCLSKQNPSKFPG
jgi:hypothetical protein